MRHASCVFPTYDSDLRSIDLQQTKEELNAIDLTDAAQLSQDMLVRGVVETIVEESAVLRYLPFIQIVGNSLRYNQEVSLGSVDFYGVGDTWTEFGDDH